MDQSPVTATGRSTPATFLNFLDEIRKVMATKNGVGASLFSFNSKGGCPACKGRGQIVTELVFMDPVTTVCEAYEFFEDNRKLRKALGAMIEVGLSYLSLGQPLSTLSGGERQRVKQADWLIDVGPDGGTAGGEIVFAGTPKDMVEHSHTITAEYLRKSL